MKIDQIKLYKTNRCIKLSYNDCSHILLDNVQFIIKHKYDNFTWLVSILDNTIEKLIELNRYFVAYDDEIKCQYAYLKNKDIVLKIKNVKGQAVLNSDINIFEIDVYKTYIAQLSLDQFWNYKGEYCYKWKIDTLRFSD